MFHFRFYSLPIIYIKLALLKSESSNGICILFAFPWGGFRCQYNILKTVKRFLECFCFKLVIYYCVKLGRSKVVVQWKALFSTDACFNLTKDCMETHYMCFLRVIRSNCFVSMLLFLHWSGFVYWFSIVKTVENFWKIRLVLNL